MKPVFLPLPNQKSFFLARKIFKNKKLVAVCVCKSDKICYFLSRSVFGVCENFVGGFGYNQRWIYSGLLGTWPIWLVFLFCSSRSTLLNLVLVFSIILAKKLNLCVVYSYVLSFWFSSHFFIFKWLVYYIDVNNHGYLLK